MIRRGGHYMIFPDAWFNGEPSEWADEPDEPFRTVLRPSEDEWGLSDRDDWETYQVDQDEETGW